MAHYFHHLTMLNRQIFLLIAGAMSRCMKLQIITDKEKERGVLATLILFLYPIFNWMAIKYPHRPIFSLFQTSLLVHCILGMIDGPITYFYQCFRPGIQREICTCPEQRKSNPLHFRSRTDEQSVEGDGVTHQPQCDSCGSSGSFSLERHARWHGQDASRARHSRGCHVDVSLLQGLSRRIRWLVKDLKVTFQWPKTTVSCQIPNSNCPQ